MRRLLLAAFLLLLPCSPAPRAAETIVEPATGAELSAEQVVARATKARFVILGETHDNQRHHELQARVLAGMVAAGRRPAVAFEMIASDQADRLARHLAERPGDAAGLGDALDWERSGWPDWTLYRPIADVALKAGLPLVGANLSRNETRALARGQAEELSVRLGLSRPLPDQLEATLAADIRAGHCNLLPETAIPPMIRVQRARDAAMAEALIEGGRRSGDGTVLIAGSGHARNDVGVPWHLRRMVPDADIFAVAFVEKSGVETADSPLPYDAAWLTAAAERADPCEGMRKHMDKKR